MAKKRYPLIGGPLDGLEIFSSDFYAGYGQPGDSHYNPAGPYAAYEAEYFSFNCAASSRKRTRVPHATQKGKWVYKELIPSMVWIHESLLVRAAKKPADLELRPRVIRSGEEVLFTLRFLSVDEDLVEDTLLDLGADGLLLTVAADEAQAIFTLATDDRDAELVEITTTLLAAGVSPFLSLVCEPSASSVLMPLTDPQS
jgi:hypothetical protein